MTFGSTLTRGAQHRMAGTPSSSQTTVLGEWRPPPSVAIFQFRSCLQRATFRTTLGPPALPRVARSAHTGCNPNGVDGNGVATRRGR